MRLPFPRVFSAVVLIVVLSALSRADSGPMPINVAIPARTAPVSYAKEIADILGARCVGCHNDALAENRLNMEDVAGMLKGGKRGASIVPGKAEQSLLFRMAAHRVEPVMPPSEKKGASPLTPEELGLLKLWIDAGARDDSAETEETATPVVLGTLPPGVQPINAMDLTADGTRVASGRANVVQVVDVDSGLEILSLGGHKDLVQSVRFSPDGRRLAAGSYQVVTLWDVPTGGGKATFTGHGDSVKAVVVTRDGATIISGGMDRTVRFWNPAGKPVRQFGTPAPVLSLDLSPDGTRLAVGGADQVVRINRVDDGHEAFALKGHTGPVSGVKFLRDGRRVVSVAMDGTGRIWTIPETPGDTPADPIVLSGGSKPLRAVAVTPDGHQIITGGDAGEILVWDADTGARLKSIGETGAPVLALAVGPDGKPLVTGSANGSARVFDSERGTLLRTLGGHPGAVEAVAFSPDGSRVVSAGGQGGIKVWEVESGQGVIAFGHLPPNGGNAQTVQGLAFTDDGTIVSASADRTLRRWAFEGRWSERRPLGPHAFRVLALDFNPDGTLLAAGGGEPSRSGEVKVWEVGKGMLVRTLDGLHSDTVFGLRFSPDGTKLASAGADKFLKITRVENGKEFRSFEGHSQHVLSVDWKSDGKQVVTGGADNVLKVWDVESGDQLRTSPPMGKQVTAVRWLLGKNLVAAASGDRQVRIVNADNASVTRTFGGPGDYLFAVATSADGGRVAAGGADGVLWVWDGKDGRVIRKLDPPAPMTPR